MNIAEQDIGAVRVLRPSGALLVADVESFLSRSRAVITASRGRMALDLSEVHYLDSAGLEALLEVAESLSVVGGVLRVCGANETVREVLELTGVGGYLEHFDSATDAARSFL
ncbi:MAG: STAS domain-containing protein [Phycisphaerales bacterium]